jgi:hypothetical protein
MLLGGGAVAGGSRAWLLVAEAVEETAEEAAFARISGIA